MFKKLLAFFAAMTVAFAFAAVDVNKATPAELDSIKGIGPAISGRIVDERKKGNFKSWEDFIERVKGIGEGNAAKFSAEGLTVSGSGYKGAAAAPAVVKKDDKPAAAAKVDAKPTTTSAAAKPEAKVDAKPAAPAVTPAGTTPAMAKDEKKAKADTTSAKPDVKPVAKDDKKADAKADASKPAASAAKK